MIEATVSFVVCAFFLVGVGYVWAWSDATDRDIKRINEEAEEGRRRAAREQLSSLQDRVHRLELRAR